MESLSSLVAYGVPFLVVLTILVFVHEQGHYLIARLCGVGVDVFSVGFGRELVGMTDRRGTRWKIGWIPVGGYVKFRGDANVASVPADAAEFSPEERASLFQFKPLGYRAAVVVAGPAANFLFAIVIFAVMFATLGQPYTPAVVSQVQADSAAAAAGFEPGDRVLAINGTAIDRFEDMQRIVRLALDEPLDVRVRRADGTEVALSAQPRIVELTDRFGNIHRVGQLGVAVSGQEFVRHGPVAAVWQAVKQTADVTVSTLGAIGQMITGTRPADELRGPLGIVEMSGQAASIGIVPIIQFMAFLSISLGLINVLPIPLLDGGHLMFYGIEAVLGRPLGERSQEVGFRIGLALVVTLMLFATWNDLVHLKVVQFVVDTLS